MNKTMIALFAFIAAAFAWSAAMRSANRAEAEAAAHYMEATR